MAKYRYTMRIEKIVYYEETIIVNAENEFAAKDLAIKEAKKMDFTFDDINKVKYNADVFSYSCNPVEE